MFHLALFSGTEGVLTPRGGTVLVLFGAAELRTATLAERIAHARERARRPLSRLDRLLGRETWVIITIFGGTELIRPTLIDEFAALRAALAAGTLDRGELRALAEATAAPPDLAAGISTFTLFGACAAVRPSPKKELAAIERAEKAGDILPQHRPVVENLIGQGEPSILRGLTRLVLA